MSILFPRIPTDTPTSCAGTLPCAGTAVVPYDLKIKINSKHDITQHTHKLGKLSVTTQECQPLHRSNSQLTHLCLHKHKRRRKQTGKRRRTKPGTDKQTSKQPTGMYQVRLEHAIIYPYTATLDTAVQAPRCNCGSSRSRSPCRSHRYNRHRQKRLTKKKETQEEHLSLIHI